MVTMPAIVWRGGSFCRGVTVGVCTGPFFGVLAWLDSGMLIAGAIVCVVLGVGSGWWMARRMARCWPRAHELSGVQRVAVVSAARRGGRLDDERLAPAVVDYGRALRAAAEGNRRVHWVIVVVLVAAVATAAWDAALGSPGNVVASCVYLLLIGLELFWWPTRRAALLTNAERASEMARQSGGAD
jgi:hypothetical protein